MFKLKKSRVEKLQERSGNILSVFTETVNNLKVVNEEIQAHKQEKIAEKAKIESHIEQLDAQATTNVNVITKIEKIFV